MSRPFVGALFGIAMTILSWYGPWEWPAWPAFAALHLMFGSGDAYHELSHGGRAAVIVMLIVINVATWGAVGYGGMTAAVWYKARRR